MKRRKITKVRTTISIDTKVFEESGEYIYNLSAFVEECMRREIAKQKEKKNRDLLRISTNKETNKNNISYNEAIEILESYPEENKKANASTLEELKQMLMDF